MKKLLILLILIGCGSEPAFKTERNTFQVWFQLGCVRNMKLDISVCRCWFAKIEDRWTEIEFLEIYNKGFMPAEYYEMRNECERK